MKNNYPDIQLSNCKEEWKLCKLGNLASIVRGASPRPIQDPKWFDSSSEVGWLRISDVSYQNGRITYLEQKLSLEGQQKTRVLLEPHLLLSIAATVGKPVINYVKTGVHDGFLIFNNPTFDKEFMFQWLEMHRPKWQKFGQPGSQVNLNSELVQNQEIFIPELNEQRRIGSFLKKIEDTITFHQQELDALKQTKQGFLQKMFPVEGMTIPEIRFPEFHEQWELKTLGEVLDSIYNGQTPSRNRKDFWNGNINWLSSGELNRGVVKTTIEKITEFGQRNANLKIVPQNTFVIAITGLEAAGTRGNCAILGMETTLNQSCMALFPKKNLLDTTFLFQWYRKVGENYGLRFTQGTKQQSYNAEIIKKLEICLPSVEEQVKIGEFFKQLDEVIEMKEKELEALKETKKGFLQKMFV